MGVQGTWPLWNPNAATNAPGGAADGPDIYTDIEINDNAFGNIAAGSI